MKFVFYLIFVLPVMSLPSRERGLKYHTGFIPTALNEVAPFAGAWIEIDLISYDLIEDDVAPFAGAWIEILFSGVISSASASSLPSRERGLKFWQSIVNNPYILSLPSRERGLK